jgi:hypothetical protein
MILLLLALTSYNGNNLLPIADGKAALAATLYVDGSIGVGQCDTYNPATRNCGSGSASAYLTIAGAAAVVQPGDTVLIQPGTYAGGVTVDTSGTASAPIMFKAKSAGVVIEGSGAERDAFFITGADYIVVEGLTIQHATRAGVRIDDAHHVTVRNCTFANNGKWGLFTDFSDYTTVEDSEAYGSVDEHGIYISNSSDSPTIRGNRLHHNHGCGLHMNGDINMGDDGIIAYAVVENNIVYENGLGGGSGINMDGVTDSVVRNNLLYNNHASGISLFQEDGGSSSQHNRVLNNTIIMPADGRWALNIPDTNNKLFNNIVINNHPYRGSILISTPTSAEFESDYNVVMDRFAADGEGDTILSLVEWNALGYDQHSFIADPSQLFVDAVANNYHLKTGSLAIDQGTALGDVTTDLEGMPRPVGVGYDIGAYEFLSSIQKDDFLGTWDGQGVYYRNSDTGAWVKMASPATLITAGDLGGDGVDDLIGIWPSQGGVWVKSSTNGAWTKLSTTAEHIAAGDMNGDGRVDFLGTWDGQGVYYRNSNNGAWVKMASPATLITAGDLDGDGIDDLIGIWPTQGGVWVKYSKTGAWSKLSSTAKDIAAGDMNGDGRDDLLGTWDGQGVYYRKSIYGAWVKMATPADQVTCGDLDADGKADLIGIWPAQGGVWVKYSATGSWAILSSSAGDIAAGRMRAGTGGSMPAQALFGPMGGYAQGPESLIQYQDTSSEGPEGLHFVYQTEELLIPQEHESGMMKIPGPGEPGFRWVEERNLIPEESRESDATKEDRDRNTK